jgi:hypothetical protein
VANRSHAGRIAARGVVCNATEALPLGLPRERGHYRSLSRLLAPRHRHPCTSSSSPRIRSFRSSILDGRRPRPRSSCRPVSIPLVTAGRLVEPPRAPDLAPQRESSLELSLTTDHASALQRVCSITRRTRLMRSQGMPEAQANVVGHWILASSLPVIWCIRRNFSSRADFSIACSPL